MLSHAALIRLCRARDLLRDLDGPVSIGTAAQVAGVSPYHFIRQFRSLFGETPHQFRIRARLERARHLLAASHYSVTEICMEVGFSSLGSFSDLFARRVGIPPSTYRRRVAGTTAGDPAPGCFSLMCGVPGQPFAISEKHRAPVLSESTDHADQIEQHHG